MASAETETISNGSTSIYKKMFRK